MAAPLTAFASKPVWFKVASMEPDDERNESYLIVLTDPDLIEQARTLAEQGTGQGVGSIVSGRVSPFADGLNRDLNAPGAPVWNWHVDTVLGFADNAIELCDGWPGLIAEDPRAFVRNTNNQICFWNYTVVEEVAAPAYGIHPGLSGAWYDPGRDGQGMFLTIDRDIPLIFLGWFTYDPLGSGGLAGQRWFTAQGPYSTESAILELFITTDGRFDANDPVNRTAPGEVGTLELRFQNCNEGSATYRLQEGPQREIQLVRLPQVARC